MHNPFQEIKSERDGGDTCRIAQALQGDSNALEDLILHHQAWIFNIALTMTGDMGSAEDVTQEVLIKIITKLSAYNPQKAAFRTWLYRIVVNHILNMKENKKELFFARMVKNNEDRFINNQPDRRITVRGQNDKFSEETKASCILCVLLCLGRKERMVFTLAVIFDVTDKVGAEICEMSRGNFRQLLSRSRKKVYQYFVNHCSLFNENNPCTCANQTEYLIQSGMMNPERLINDQNSLGTIQSILGNSAKHMEDSYDEFLALFRDRPFLQGPDMVSWLRDLTNSDAYRNLMEFTEL
ncbi:MAG: RNA polymerase sigma factor [Smithellaceae bacterium]